MHAEKSEAGFLEAVEKSLFSRIKKHSFKSWISTLCALASLQKTYTKKNKDRERKGERERERERQRDRKKIK